MKALTPSFLIAALASLALIGCNRGGSGSGGDVATVNGESISMDEFHKYLERKPAVQVSVQNNPQAGQALQALSQGQPAELSAAAPLGFQALRDLINRHILLEVAQDEKVMPTDADIKKELDFQTKQRPNFMQSLTSQGLSLEDIRHDLTLDLARTNLITKGITVTPDDVNKFIKDNPDKFKTPEEARIRIVQVHDKAGEDQVDAALKSGQPFGQVAVQYSVDPRVRETQGVYPVTVVAQMQPALQQIVHTTDQLKTTGWIPDGGNFVKLYIERKVAPTSVKPDDTMRENVRRSLALERGSQASDLSQRLVQKLKDSKVTVTPPELKTLWDKAFDELRKSGAAQANAAQSSTQTSNAAGAPAAGAPKGK